MHDDVPTFWNRSNIYPKMGYELIASKKDFIATGTPIFDHLEDKEFFRQSVHKLKDLPQPFMATLITLSSHTPYTIPKSTQNLRIPDNTPLTERQWHYLQSIHYVDAAIGVLIDELKAEGLYDNSLIIIFGDHGSFTGIEDVLVPPRAAPIAGDLKRNHVPLIILAPGTGLKGARTIPGSHLDLYPTILNLLGIKEPRHTLGQDLLNTKTPVVTHRDPDARFITSILTADRYFYAGENGSFENGGCLAIPGDQPLPLSDCRMLYKRELSASNVSDLIVKGNLLPVVTGSTRTE
jgi:phosphoglycerol transferase MdoB-like AlkP superfamily enzyme